MIDDYESSMLLSYDVLICNDLSNIYEAFVVLVSSYGNLVLLLDWLVNIIELVMLAYSLNGLSFYTLLIILYFYNN